ncbi:MAG: hypothetical protein ACXV8U_13470, partial [Methylobacter sp.]
MPQSPLTTQSYRPLQPSVDFFKSQSEHLEKIPLSSSGRLVFRLFASYCVTQELRLIQVGNESPIVFKREEVSERLRFWLFLGLFEINSLFQVVCPD